MKRKILSLVLVFAMTVSLFTVGTGAVEPTYGDTAGHWAESAIERWSDHGIIQGSKGAFDPDGQLTCGQLATILAKLLKLPAAKDAGFTDNTANAWYYDAINRCAASGILNGNGDGTVTPEAPITRERAMVMLGRALGIEPISAPDLTKYVDAAQVSTYARGYVAALIEAGIVGGVAADQLAPQANINRASTVTILDRAIAVYADEDGQTIDASKVNGLILIAAKNVTVKDAPKGTSVLVCKDASGATVNGKAVDAGTSVTAEEAQPVKPTTGGGSSGGSTPSRSNLIVTESKTVSGGTYQNVTITDAVGDGEVTLTGLTIRGDLAIKGGGSNSIKLIDCIIQGKIILNKLIPEGAQQPRLELTNTPARKVEVQSPAIIEATDENSKIDMMEVKDDLTIKGDKTAVDAITVPAGASPEVNVKDGSKVDKIEAKGTTTVKTTSDSVVGTIAAESDVNVSGNINAITVPETANDSVNIAIDSGTTVPEVTVNSDKGTTISGEGTVSNIAASSDEAKDSISGDKVDPSAIADHVHAWNAGTVTTEAGCSSTGIKTYTCTVDDCNASKSEILPVLGHKWGSWEKVDETNHKRVCANDAGHIETAEHSWDTGVITKAATCTEKGIKTYTCAICSAGKTEDIDALGHDFAADFTVDKAATCTEAGSKSKHCSRCDAKDAVTEIPATGHTFAAEWSKDADCHWHAATCGHTAEVKDKAEHSWNSGVVTTSPTTTTAGVKTYTCTVCNATKTETIPAEGAETVAAATGVTIDQSGVCIRVTIEQPADTSHIASYQVNLYNSADKSNRHADRPGCSISSGRAWFGYWDALYTDFDKIEVISVAEDGYANAVWTGDISIAATEAGTLSYELNYNTAQKYLEATLTTAPANASYRVINEGYKNGWENYTADGNTIKLRSTGDGSIKDGTSVSIGAWTLDKCEKNSAGEWQIAYTVYPVGAEVTANIPHVHEWDKGEITTEPTSSVDGVRTYTCSGCGETKTETVSKDRVCNIRFEKDGGRFQLVWDAPLNAASLSQPEYNVYLKSGDSWIKISGTDQTLLRYPVDEVGDYTAVRVETTTETDNNRTALASREQVVVFKVSATTGGAPTSVTWSKNAELTAEWNMPAYDERVTGVTPNVWGELQLRVSDRGHSSGTLTGEDGVWTATVGSGSMEEYLASGEYRFLEYLNVSVSDDGLTASYTVNQRGDWTACSSESAAKAWINATESNLKLEWTPKKDYDGVYFVNGESVGRGTTYPLPALIRNAAKDGKYSFTISIKEDANSAELTSYITLENAVTVSIDTAKTPNVAIKGLEDGNYEFESQNGFTGIYDYDLCAPDGTVIREWWVKAGGTAALAPYEGCKFKVRELSWTETGNELSAITIKASSEGTFGFKTFVSSELSVTVTDESTFSDAVNKDEKVTVTLNNDITIENTQINRGGDVEIDLNGHTLDLGASNSLAIGKAVKFTDSSVKKTGTIAGAAGIRCDAGSMLDLYGITVARVTDGGKMRGITIENCKVTYLIQLTNANEMNVVNTDFSGDVQVKIYNSTASFDRCTFDGGSDQNILQLNGDANVTLDNATFSSGTVSLTGSNNTLTLKSGTYCFDPKSYVPVDGYTVAHDEGTSVWTVSASTSA